MHISDDAASNTGLQEFDLVQNAMYTDPRDQSVWIYHRWLIGSGMRIDLSHTNKKVTTGSGDNKEILDREIAVIQSLLEEETDSKCRCISFC